MLFPKIVNILSVFPPVNVNFLISNKLPLVWSHPGSERQASGLSAGVRCLRRAARVLSLGCCCDSEHHYRVPPRGAGRAKLTITP
ncbi:hypothetical protein CEXT_318791 [Caerostris extrusa]|uniref:Uncharacterized protein n=1 Tax=Caerostris extrusa TaxID=172846 RepID=A0AAV4MH54_CAEEX|nr:hypothetical protein CEXT_318791 [Caerostris extrusa]